MRLLSVLRSVCKSTAQTQSCAHLNEPSDANDADSVQRQCHQLLHPFTRLRALSYSPSKVEANSRDTKTRRNSD
ncbi:hypothetical protein SARC_14212, partial [Sphaeroforma arctica JP610]